MIRGKKAAVAILPLLVAGALAVFVFGGSSSSASKDQAPYRAISVPRGQAEADGNIMEWKGYSLIPFEGLEPSLYLYPRGSRTPVAKMYLRYSCRREVLSALLLNYPGLQTLLPSQLETTFHLYGLPAGYFQARDSRRFIWFDRYVVSMRGEDYNAVSGYEADIPLGEGEWYLLRPTVQFLSANGQIEKAYLPQSWQRNRLDLSCR